MHFLGKSMKSCLQQVEIIALALKRNGVLQTVYFSGCSTSLELGCLNLTIYFLTQHQVSFAEVKQEFNSSLYIALFSSSHTAPWMPLRGDHRNTRSLFVQKSHSAPVYKKVNLSPAFDYLYSIAINKHSVTMIVYWMPYGAVRSTAPLLQAAKVIVIQMEIHFKWRFSTSFTDKPRNMLLIMGSIYIWANIVKRGGKFETSFYNVLYFILSPPV